MNELNVKHYLSDKLNFSANDIQKLEIFKIQINFSLYENDYQYHKIDSEYIVCRAFKKLPKILEISREKAVKPHKLIILKGKDTQEKIKSAFKGHNHKYRLISSITDKESKIVIAETVK